MTGAVGGDMPSMYCRLFLNKKIGAYFLSGTVGRRPQMDSVILSHVTYQARNLSSISSQRTILSSCFHQFLTSVMSHSTLKPHTLPIIDISPYLNDHDLHGRVSVSAALHSACLEYGFFYLDITKYADPSEPEELTRLARQFFALPQHEKDKIALKNQDHARCEFILSLRLKRPNR